MTSTPAYLINEGDSVQFPNTGRFKKVYRVEDAGVRFSTNDIGQAEHIPQITCHVNAPTRSGIGGTYTCDFDTDVVASLMADR